MSEGEAVGERVDGGKESDGTGRREGRQVASTFSSD